MEYCECEVIEPVEFAKPPKIQNVNNNYVIHLNAEIALWIIAIIIFFFFLKSLIKPNNLGAARRRKSTSTRKNRVLSEKILDFIFD